MIPLESPTVSKSVSMCVSSIVPFLRIPDGVEGWERERDVGMVLRSAVGNIDWRRCG